MRCSEEAAEQRSCTMLAVHGGGLDVCVCVYRYSLSPGRLLLLLRFQLLLLLLPFYSVAHGEFFGKTFKFF